MSRTIFVLLLSFIMLAPAISQQEPMDFTDDFFTKISEQAFDQAAHELPLGELLINDTLQLNQVSNGLKNASMNLGDYCGYELIEADTLSDSYITFTYLIKYSGAPQTLVLVCYKPKNSWQVNAIRLRSGATVNAPQRPRRRPFR